MKNLIERWFGPKPEPVAPPVDHGNAKVFKVGQKIRCIRTNPRLFITRGKIYEVPFIPSDELVPVYNDVHGFSLCYPDQFVAV